MKESRTLKKLFLLGMLGVVALGVVALIGGTPADAAPCIGCIPTPGMPMVYCTDGRVYPNICVAQANCQYNCQAFLVKGQD